MAFGVRGLQFLRIKHFSFSNVQVLRCASQRSGPSTNKGSGKSGNDTKTINSSAGSYQAQEYHEYNPYSFYDIELTMVKDRLKQPNPKDSS